MKESEIGKLTPTALYVHESALNSVSPLLRIYEACARKLLGLNEPGTVIKMHRREPAISYLFYPEFFDEAHPPLRGGIRVCLQDLKSTFRDYSTSENPPILHRKEHFLHPDHPDRQRFAEPTTHEDATGLFESPRTIGNRNGWLALLARRGLKIEQHRLRPAEGVIQ